MLAAEFIVAVNGRIRRRDGQAAHMAAYGIPNMTQFFKNVSTMGGLLMVAAFGPGL